MSTESFIRETVRDEGGEVAERSTPYLERSVDEYVFWCVRSNGRRSYYTGPDSYFSMPGVHFRVDGSNVTSKSVRAWIDRRDSRLSELGISSSSTPSAALAEVTLARLLAREASS